jgi:hypothetical protein
LSKKKLANRSDRQPQSARKNRSGFRGRRSLCGNGPTVRRGIDPKEQRAHVRGQIREQHKRARLEAEKNHLGLVTEEVARMIRAAGGPAFSPVATQMPLPPERVPELLTGMPRDLVARIQSPPEEWNGLGLETKVMLAVEEWKALNR